MWSILIGILIMVLSPSFWVLLFKPKIREKELLVGWQIIKVVAGSVLGFLISYFMLIDHTISGSIISLLPILTIIYFVDGIMLTESDGSLDSLSLIGGGILAIVWLFMIFFYPMTITKDLSKMVNAKTSSNSIEETSIDHIIVVSPEYASYKGQQLLSNVSNNSLYSIGKYHEQKIGDELFWVAPLEYKGTFVPFYTDSIPGYIKVSAENITKPAELIDTCKMKYVPSAYFGKNLERIVRNKYPNIIIMESSFEPDDSGKPYYVVSYGHYSKFRNGDVVDGAVLVDPQTGDMTQYRQDEVPAWADQTIPANVANDYNDYFGKYQDGIFAYWFNPTNVKIPTKWETGDEVIGVYDNNNNRMSWFTDFTTKTASNSMEGYTLMDARTGQLTYYTGANGFLNGQAAMSAVNKSFNKDAWKSSTPVLYNIYQEDTWVIPVVDGDGKFRKLAVVNARTGNVVSGDTKKQVFELYKAMLANQNIDSNKDPNDNNALVSIEGEVFRVNHVSTTNGDDFKIMLKDNTNKIFSVNSSLLPYVVFVQPGDKISMKYIDTKETIATVQEFHDTTLGN